jgi:hypothetical protein
VKREDQAFVAEWLLRLSETAAVLWVGLDIDAALRQIAKGGEWSAVSARKGGEAWMLAEGIARAAAAATRQAYRLPSGISELVAEFRDHYLEQASMLRWELLGFGVEDAEWLAEVGHRFREFQGEPQA